MMVTPLTYGCQQVPCRVWRMIGRATSSCSRLSISRELDAVEIGPVFFPIVGIPRQLDRLVGFELDEPERAGADRVRAHLGRRDVAGIDRRITRGEQSQQRRLRPL